MADFDNGIPMPVPLEEAAELMLKAMKAHQSLLVRDENSRKRYLMVAKRKRIKIRTLKEAKGFRIWRIR